MTATTPSQQAFGKNYGGNAAENYERFFVPAIGAPLAADLIAAADLRPGERVLDVACGTGIVARLAAERVGATGTVAGLDANAAMLAVARSLTDLPIRWYETPAESIPLPDETFDAVLCQFGLQFFADKDAALREMRRVLVPGGRIVVNVPTPTAFFNILDDALARYLPAGAGFVRKVFSLNDTAEIERFFRNAQFRDVVARRDSRELLMSPPRETLWQYVQSTPLAGLVAEADDDLLQSLERDVVGGWQPWVRDESLSFRHEAIFVTAQR